MPLLHRVVNSDRSPRGWSHRCPGCQSTHVIDVDEPNRWGARWTFDGVEDRPTFSPSVNCSWGTPDVPPGVSRCHYFLRAGVIEYLPDCTHPLAGKSVPLPDFDAPMRDPAEYLS